MVSTIMTDFLLPDDITALARHVITRNAEIGRTVALAESCTGGLVGAALTEIAGSSKVFQCGFDTYSNDAKIDLLGVNPDLIDTFGAVSVAVGWAMAQGALLRSNSDVAVAITGVAGPDGGTEEKPVGTVVFAKAERGKSDEEVVADLRHFNASDGRAEIRRQATLCALELLLPGNDGEAGVCEP